jgi:hypothetical protein
MLHHVQADTITGWSRQYRQQTVTLLQFLVRLSKQEKLAHVWLATSDYSYQGWLADGK